MKRPVVLLASAAILASGLVAIAPPAPAAITWDYASGSFTLRDIVGDPATLTIRNLQVTGSSARGQVLLANGGRLACDTSSFSGLTATFTTSSYNPCHGTVTLAVDASGALSVVDSAVYIPTMYLTGPGTGTVAGVGPRIASCTSVLTASGDAAEVAWAALGSGITEFSVGVVNGQNATVDVGGGATSVQVPLAGENPGQLELAIEINGEDSTITSCGQVPYFPAPGAPSMVGTPIGVTGGQVTVNYSVANPVTAQGIEVQIDGGAWQRPGGSAPNGGVGGSFTLAGLTEGTHTLALQSVGFGPKPLTTPGSVAQFEIPAAPKRPSTSSRPSQATGTVAIGSSPTKPVSAPPVAPMSVVAGTSNGAGTGTNGALAANTGDPGIDAPCLAEDGTLYPTLYSTVGSQLTMAPNTRGFGSAKAFTVVAGALPPGMQLDRTYGVLFGVTTQAGSWVTTVEARFADGSKKTSQFTTRVDGDPQTLQYAAQNIGSVGTRMAIAPTTNASAVGTTYTLVCGELPAGTRLDTRTGAIVGKPTAVVARPIPLRVAESSATGKAAASFIFVVNKAGTTSFSYPAHPHMRVGKRVAIRPTVAGVGEIALFRMWKGKLPKGLHLSSATGVVSGRIAHGGRTHTITIVAVTKGGALLTAEPMRLSLGSRHR